MYTSVLMWICMYTCDWICIYLYVHMRICMYTYVCIWICLHTHLQIWICMYAYVCMWICMYIDVHTWIYIHISLFYSASFFSFSVSRFLPLFFPPDSFSLSTFISPLLHPVCALFFCFRMWTIVTRWKIFIPIRNVHNFYSNSYLIWLFSFTVESYQTTRFMYKERHFLIKQINPLPPGIVCICHSHSKFSFLIVIRSWWPLVLSHQWVNH